MPARVRKRDGREVPFDAHKIEAAVAQALVAVGEDDGAFASEIAGVVTLTLEGRYDAASRAPGVSGAGETLPDIEEIQDLVERALIELGRANVAKAYILYRDRRARAREALEVHESADPTKLSARARVEVQTPERSTPWSKSRIVAALINEAQLTREVAARVATRVEERVFAAGLKRISTALIRELVDNELVSLGLSAALQRQWSYGLPSYDLRAVLSASDAPLDPARVAAGEALVERRVEGRVTSEVLRRFALAEVLSEESARLHLAGDFHVVEIGRPQQPLTCAVPAQLVVAGAPSVEASFEALEELGELARDVSHGLVIEDVATLLQPFSGSARSALGLGAWLRALTAVAAAAGRNIDLCAASGFARAHASIARTIEQLAVLGPSPFAPRLFIDHAELARLLADGAADAQFSGAVEKLLLAGRMVVTWGDADESCVGPGLHRFAQERAALACGGAVALNMPRIALRAGPWREDRALELLAGVCAAAVTALHELASFQGRVRGSRPADLRARVAYAVTPIGLREALAFLGDGEIRPDQGARLLGFLADALERFGAEHKLSLALTPFFGERVRARFAGLDAELPQHAQRLLFHAGAGVDRGAPYSVGYRLSPVPGRVVWAAEAELLSTVAVGALHPLPEDRSRGGVVSLVDAWQRFDRMRVREGDAAEREHSPAAAAASLLFDPATAPAARGTSR